MTTMPVLVVGAGPVGLSTALLLARWGVRSVVVDRLPAREPIGSRSICQQGDVLDIWSAVGAGRRIAEEGVTWRTARTYVRDRELFAVTLPDSGRSVFPPFVNLSQSRTEAVLDRCAADSQLVDVRWGHEVVGIEQDALGVTALCRTANGVIRLSGGYAVVCTGGGGDLRERLGVGFAGRSFADRFLICDVEADLPGWEAERRFYFDPVWNPGRQVLIHPCPNRTYRIDWQVPAGFDTGETDDRIRAVVGTRPYRLHWSSVYRFHQRIADRMRVGRVLLAGDCAHLYAPFGARGLNSGVQDAENAAWKLAFVLRGWADERLLDSYHDERHAAAKENLEVTGATMRFLAPHTVADRARRDDVLRRALTDPAARAEVDSGRLAEPFAYDGSRLTTTDPEGRCGGLVPAGPLRSLVRDGLLALCAADADAVELAAAVLARAVPAPSRALALPDADAAELAARPGETRLIRPDGHIAAVVDGPAALAEAARRACGLSPAG